MHRAHAPEVRPGDRQVVLARELLDEPGVAEDDPVPDGEDSQSAAAIALADGLAVGTFNRALGGLIAWDRATGKRLWSVVDDNTVAINASPIFSSDSVYVVSGADDVSALDLTGQLRWRVKLDPDGFDWGNATIGTPALADGVLVVPTLYRDLVALDAETGTELWRSSGTPSPIRTTHYRGGGQAGFSASPVITGGIVWAADIAGLVRAIDLQRRSDFDVGESTPGSSSRPFFRRAPIFSKNSSHKVGMSLNEAENLPHVAGLDDPVGGEA